MLQIIRKVSLISIATTIGLVAIASMISVIVLPVIGHKAIGMLFLLAIHLNALFFKRYMPVLAALLSGLSWNFLHITPRFTFSVDSYYDWLMLGSFLISSLIIGYYTKKIRTNQARLVEEIKKNKSLQLAREKMLKTLQQKEIFQESERIYKTLLNSVSHELITPISAIKGFLSTLKQKNNIVTNEQLNEITNEIHESTDRLETVVKNLLDMSRVESGKLSLRLEISDLVETIYSALKKIEHNQGNRKFALDRLPNIITLKIDQVLIEQCFINIFNNACSYTPDHTTVEVEFIQQNSDSIEIIINDNGPGLGDNPEFIFKKFYRGGPKITGGIGLGLSITKAIIDLHGGTISAKNRTSGGAEFHITLPTKIDHANE